MNDQAVGPIDSGTAQHIIETLAWQTETIKRLDEAIRGNGKPGFKQELAEVRSDLALCQQRRDIEAKHRKEEAEKKNTIWSRFGQPVVAIVYGGVALLIIWGATGYIASKMDVKTEVRKALVEMQRETP